MKGLIRGIVFYLFLSSIYFPASLNEIYMPLLNPGDAKFDLSDISLRSYGTLKENRNWKYFGLKLRPKKNIEFELSFDLRDHTEYSDPFNYRIKALNNRERIICLKYNWLSFKGNENIIKILKG